MQKSTSRIIAVVMAVIMVMTFCSCSGGKEKISPDEITSRLCDIDSNIKYVELVPEQIPSFFNISVSSVNDYSVYIADSENFSNTVAVFELLNTDDKSVVLDAINSYVTGLSKTFELSNTNEYKKLQARKIMQLDNCIVLIVSDNIDNMLTELTEMGGKAVN